MVKKTLAAILITLLLFGLLSLASCSKREGDFEYSVSDGEVTIRYYKDRTGVSEVVIPDTIGGMPVVAVADGAIVNTYEVTAIRIGKNLRTFSKWAITNNIRLRSFTVDPYNPYFTTDSEGVLFSKDMSVLVAYPNARNLTFNPRGEVTNTVDYAIPEGVKTIREMAFYKCSYIKTVTFPHSLETVGERAFDSASALEAVILYENIRRIEDMAFEFCSAVKELSIQGEIEYIGKFAFYSFGNKKDDNKEYVLQSVTINAYRDTAAGWGDRWYPSDNGDEMAGVEIIYGK